MPEMGHGWGAIIAIVLWIVIVLLPPKYDPAIRLKEWLERRRKNDN